MKPRDSLQSCLRLFHQCLTLSRRNNSLLKPAFQMAFVNLVVISLLLLEGSALITRPMHTMETLLVLITTSLIALPLRAFIRIRLMAVSAAMIYEQIQNKRIVDAKSAWHLTKGRAATYLTFLLANALLAMFFRRQSTARIKNPLWDVMTHYMIPVITIEKLSFRQALVRTQDLFKHAGVSMGGMFGIDIVGGAFRILFGLATLFLALISTGLGYLNMSLYGDFAITPLLVSASLLLILHCLGKPFFDLLKILYFTSLYQKIRTSHSKN